MKIKHILPQFTPGQYYTLMRSFANLKGFENNDIAQFRLTVLNHCYSFGWKAAVAAFNVPKSTLFDWKKSFEKSSKKLSSLIPKSTKPYHTRRMVVDIRLLEFIKSMREEFGAISKYKLRPFLDEYAKSLGLSGYGLDKIGLIIKRNRYFFERKAKAKRKVKPLIPRLKRAPNQNIPGYLETDSITIYVNSRKYYFVTIIDIVTKFAWCKMTTSLSSKAAKEALAEFISRYPYSIRVIQTDNGHEFLGEFDQYLMSLNIPHQFIYPRSPKINGVVERFNRTIQDEFINRNQELWINTKAFKLKLSGYLEWYNTRRPHHSLNLVPPIIYMQQFPT